MINPSYKDVPDIEEKAKHLALIIDCQRASVQLWEAQMPRYELLPKVKEDLRRNEKMLLDLTGGLPCPKPA